jgi:hypothetical protein
VGSKFQKKNKNKNKLIFTFVLGFFFFFLVEEIHATLPGFESPGSYVKHKQGPCSAASEKDASV